MSLHCGHWSAPQPDTTQALVASHHVHFALNTSSAAPGSSLGQAPGPSGHHEQEEDPFLASTPVQPLNQVGVYFILFIFIYSINLLKGGFHPPLGELFNLADVSDGSQEGGVNPIMIPDPGPATPSRRQRRIEKAGSRQGKSAEDAQTFFQIVDGKKFCNFCL